MNNRDLEQMLTRIEEAVADCETLYDTIEHLCEQARASSKALRSACEHVEEYAELRSATERDSDSVSGDTLPGASG